MKYALRKILVIWLTISGGICLQAAEKPNILWLTSEDNNTSWVGCYGNEEANTPHIDQLARDGFQYMQCYANVPVCAPQRSTWITGVHALSMGTQPMRSRYAIPHDRIRYYPDYLKEAGYYVSNHTKTDYNIGGRKDKACWDSDEKYGWRNRAPGQPFFCIINGAESHESRAHGNVEDTIHDPENVRLKAYHPDLPDVRKNYAKYHDAVARMDTFVGDALAELEKDGLLETTIVIYNSDHGGVMARSKRFLFESGLHCPLIIRIPERFRQLWPAGEPGSKVDGVVSFIDMIPTWLSLAGAEIPAHMQGRVFLGEDAGPDRKLHFAYRGRMDERIDNQRAVHDGRYLYIKNYMPYAPWGQRLEYLWRQVAMQAWDAHHKEGKTDAITGRFFGSKPVEELYDTQSDPDCVHNLAETSEQTQRLGEFRSALREWQLRIHDTGMIPEMERLKRAEDNHLTLYELVREPSLYDLPAYLDAADLALAGDPANLEKLQTLLSKADSGLRWWGTVGLLMLGEEAAPAASSLRALLKDPSPDVRAYAAWVAVQLGDVDAGLSALGAMIETNSPAILTVLNVLDYLGEPARALADTVAEINPKATGQAGYVERMQAYLIKKMVGTSGLRTSGSEDIEVRISEDIGRTSGSDQGK